MTCDDARTRLLELQREQLPGRCGRGASAPRRVPRLRAGGGRRTGAHGGPRAAPARSTPPRSRSSAGWRSGWPAPPPPALVVGRVGGRAWCPRSRRSPFCWSWRPSLYYERAASAAARERARLDVRGRERSPAPAQQPAPARRRERRHPPGEARGSPGGSTSRRSWRSRATPTSRCRAARSATSSTARRRCSSTRAGCTPSRCSSSAPTDSWPTGALTRIGSRARRT